MYPREYFLKDYRNRFPDDIKKLDVVIEACVFWKNQRPTRASLITWGRTPIECFKKLAPALNEDCIVVTSFYFYGEHKKPWSAFVYRNGKLTCELLTVQPSYKHRDFQEIEIENIIREATSH